MGIKGRFGEVDGWELVPLGDLDNHIAEDREYHYALGRKEALEEIVEKFGGGVYITIEGTIGGKKEVITARPELDVWIEKELDKLKGKDNG